MTTGAVDLMIWHATMSSESPGSPLDTFISSAHEDGEASTGRAATPEDGPTQVISPEMMQTLANAAIAGRYDIVRKLGRGGFGIVYQARDQRLERQVAIKLLNERCEAGSPEAIRFLKEAKILASLDHPNIVPIYDADLDGDHPYIAMKYVPGQPLSKKICDRPLAETDALRIVRDIATGLAHAHERGVLHRDIKPSNVIVDDNDHAYLVDFGLSVSQFQSFSSNHIAGTLPYIAPEVLSGELIESSDLYSVGAVLYEMLFREPCFDHNDQASLIYKILNEKPSCLDNPTRKLGTGCQSLLERLLEKSAQKRPASALTLVREIEAILLTVSRSRTTRRVKDLPVDDLTELLEPVETSLESLVEHCQQKYPKIDKVIELISCFLHNAEISFEQLGMAFKLRPEDLNCEITILSLIHLAREARDRLISFKAEDDPDVSFVDGAIVQLETRVLTPARQLLRELEIRRDLPMPPPADFFLLDDEHCEEEASLDSDWIDDLRSKHEIDQYDALMTLIGSGQSSFIASLAARPSESRDEVFEALWRKVDILLLEGRGRARPIFEAALALASDSDLKANWRQLYSLFQRSGDGYWDPGVIALNMKSKHAEDQRVIARSLLIHPWDKYRQIARDFLKPSDFWYAITNKSTPVSSILEIWRHLKSLVKPDYLKIFFVSINDRLRQPGGPRQALIALEFVKEFYSVDCFHESFFFKTLTNLENAIRHELQRHRYPVDLDKEYVAQMRQFLKRSATDDRPVRGLIQIPLPVQRILARRGHFQDYFCCHPVDPIALECLKHIQAREDISAFLKLFNINARLLAEIAKDQLHFREEQAKYLLVANPKTQPFVVAKYIGYLRADKLRYLANSRECNSFAREYAARLLKKKETARSYEMVPRRRGR